jgi:Spy/CpxP family protein refolding chaperone
VSASAAGPSAATGWPRRRLLITLLAVSAVLNLFFVAGAMWIRLHPPTHWQGREQRYQQMTAELDLNPQQQTGFDRYVAAMRASTEKMRQEIGPLIGSTWDEMAKPDADAAKINARFDEASEKWRRFQHETTTQTLDFLSMLSPQQRVKFVAIARERHAPWRRQHAGKH